MINNYYQEHRQELLDKAAKYREKYRDELRERSRQIREAKNNTCKDCVKVIGPAALRCRNCAAKVLNDKRKVTYPLCIDCGGTVSRGRSVRCRSCASKANRKGNWLDDNRFVAATGYIMIRDKDDRDKGGWGYAYEHIKIWESSHKKTLPKGWHIHHLNGIKTDNRIINLVALPDFKHKNVLASKAKRIQELEALLNNQGQLM